MGHFCSSGIRRFRFIQNSGTFNNSRCWLYRFRYCWKCFCSFTVFDNGDINSFGSSTTNNSYNGVTNSIQSSRQCTSVTDYGTGNFRFNWDMENSNHGTHNY